MSPVIDCSEESGREEGLRAAADAVRAGRLVVVPTDTVYGIGADAFDAAAVAALLEAKGRGREMPPPVLVPSPRTVDGLATAVPEYARRLVDRYWPGALTLVLRAQASLMWDLGETNGTVAVRMPDHPLALQLLAETGPMAVTSANRHGEPPARTVIEAATQLGPSVTVYLDGGRSSDGEASTILDCTGDVPIVLRHGAIPEAEIRAFLDRPESEEDPRHADGSEVVGSDADGSDADGYGQDGSSDVDISPEMGDDDSHPSVVDALPGESSVDGEVPVAASAEGLGAHPDSTSDEGVPAASTPDGGHADEHAETLQAETGEERDDEDSHASARRRERPDVEWPHGSAAVPTPRED